MKNLLIILLCLMIVKANATNWYFSAAGNDAAPSNSISTPWRTLSKLNATFSAMTAGDSVLFRAGDLFAGSVLINKSGIKFSSYGIGIKPVINGLSTVSGWVSVGAGVWKAPVIAPNDLRYVLFEGVNKEWARTPQKGRGLSSYYYTTAFNNGTPKTITVGSLTVSPNRVGNRFAYKGETWFLSIFKCTTQVSNVLTYIPGVVPLLGGFPVVKYANRTGAGVIFVGNVADVDTLGEWAYDSTNHQLYGFFGATDPNSLNIQTTIFNRGIDLQALSGISIENIKIQGYNQEGIYGRNSIGGGNIKIKNCVIDGIGGYGVLLSNVPNIIVEDDTVKSCYSIGLRLPNNNISGASVQRNYLDSTNNPFETMYYTGADIDGDGLVIGMNNQTTSYNTIKTAAYTGIWFSGTNVVLERNEVTNWSKWSNDCGGTYTHALTGAEDSDTHYIRYKDRFVINNWLHDATAWPYGFSTLSASSCKGMYNDDQSMWVTYSNNFVNNVDIGSANNVDSLMTFYNNTIIATQGLNFFNKSYSNIISLKFTNNIMSNLLSTSFSYYYLNDNLGTRSIAQSISPTIKIDTNICNSGGQGYGTETYTSPGVGFKKVLYNLSGWQSVTGLSPNDILVPYLPFSETGRKVVTNWTATIAVKSLNGIYKDYRGNTYTNSITLPPYTNVLLYYFGNTPPPPPSGNVKGIPSRKTPVQLN